MGNWSRRYYVLGHRDLMNTPPVESFQVFESLIHSHFVCVFRLNNAAQLC